MTKDEALKLALEALEKSTKYFNIVRLGESRLKDTEIRKASHAAMKAIEEALAQPEQPEQPEQPKPPPEQRQPLTDEQRDAERYRQIRRGQKWSVIDGTGGELRAEQLDAAIDAAHNIKEQK